MHQAEEKFEKEDGPAMKYRPNSNWSKNVNTVKKMKLELDNPLKQMDETLEFCCATDSLL